MAKVKEMTVESLFRKVWDEHWNTERYIKSGHARVVRENYNNHIHPEFGSLLLSAVSRLAIRQWHTRLLLDRPIAANRSLETLSKMFNYASEQEIFTLGNPCAYIKPGKERKRTRYATEEEIKSLGKILFREARETRTAVGAVFLLSLLFTGARPRSLERARYVDLKESHEGFGYLTFEGKSTAETGEEETVVFPPQVMDLIATLPKRNDGLIFGIKLPKDIWQRVREEAGCPDLWARDLRRTFATVGMSNGVKMDTISELLNHKSVQTTKLYAKLQDTARTKAAEHIANKMSSLLGEGGVGKKSWTQYFPFLGKKAAGD